MLASSWHSSWALAVVASSLGLSVLLAALSMLLLVLKGALSAGHRHALRCAWLLLGIVMPPVTLVASRWMPATGWPGSGPAGETLEQWLGVTVLGVPLILFIWCMGFGFALVPVIAGVASVSRSTREGRLWGGQAVASIQEDARKRLGVSRTVRLRLARSGAMPMVSGVLRPVVLLPGDAVGWGSDRIRAVLFHEFAHVARWDVLTTLLARVSCAMHWFNPLMWTTHHRLVADREMAADDLAAALMESDVAYAENVAAVAASSSAGQAFVGPGMNGGGRTRGFLLERVQYALDRGRSHQRVTRIDALRIGVACGLLGVAVASWIGAPRVVGNRSVHVAPTEQEKVPDVIIHEIR